MHKTASILVVLAALCFSTLVLTEVSTADTFRLVGINFYEGPKEGVDFQKRIYYFDFPKSTTRFIFTEVSIQNLLYHVRDHSHDITYRYYRSDGSLLREKTRRETIRSINIVHWFNFGCGWSDPGEWPSGAYTVEVMIDGEFIGKKKFTIYSD